MYPDVYKRQTTCEAKSGYGLNLEHELKQLKVVRELNRRHPIDLISTFLGAHAIPVDYKNEREEFIRQLCEDMIPICLLYTSRCV